MLHFSSAKMKNSDMNIIRHFYVDVASYRRVNPGLMHKMLCRCINIRLYPMMIPAFQGRRSIDGESRDKTNVLTKQNEYNLTN